MYEKAHKNSRTEILTTENTNLKDYLRGLQCLPTEWLVQCRNKKEENFTQKLCATIQPREEVSINRTTSINGFQTENAATNNKFSVSRSESS